MRCRSMNQCPFCKSEIFSDEISRCPACGQVIEMPGAGDDSASKTQETFLSDEFPSEGRLSGDVDGIDTIDDPTVSPTGPDASSTLDSNDSVMDEETFHNDELPEHVAEPGAQTLADDEGDASGEEHRTYEADATSTVPQLNDDSATETVNLDGSPVAPAPSWETEATMDFAAEDDDVLQDADATFVQDDEDDPSDTATVTGDDLQRVLDADDNNDRTFMLDDDADQRHTADDGDSYDATLVSDDVSHSPSSDSSQTFVTNVDASDEELKTLQTNWSANAGAEPEMTIKSRAELADSAESSPTDTITAVPVRSMRGLNEYRSGLDSPEYELLSVLGEGGMGIVWSARQTSVDRSVAVKMIKGNFAGKRAQRNKFLAEAIVTGDLDHPNIVPIYDVGVDKSGSLFYAMKQVKGTPWLKVIKEKSLHENLEILLRVADAVAFAHARGIVHRDLKPENVMLGEYGEVLVMDWGLALPLRQFRKAERIRQFSSMGGTPAYMSPEMATGPIDRITPQSDIYLIGAMLWEIVTGKPPHPGKKVQQCLLAAMRNTIRSTEKSGELVDIALKAMATDVADRHATVREFQDEVRSYLDHSESLALAAHAREDLGHAQQTGDYNEFSKAVFGFEQARELWPGNQAAEKGIREAKLAYATTAYKKEDYDLALSLLSSSHADQQQLRTEILHAQRERNARQGRLKFAKRAMTAMAVCFLVVVSIGFVVIRQERNEAMKQKGIAEAKSEEAEAQRAVAVKQTGIAEAALIAVRREKEEVERQKTIAEMKTQEAIVSEAEAKRQAMIAAKNEMEAKQNALEAARQEKIALAKKVEADREREEADKQRKIAELQKAEAEKQKEKAEANEQEALRQEKIARQQRDEADRQRLLAEQAKESEEYEAYIARIGLAAAKIEENAFDVAIELLGQCPERHRNWEWGRLMHLCEQASEYLTANGPVDAVAVSPDGQYLLAGSWDNTARIWDLKNQQIVRELAHDGLYVHSADWSPDQKLIATGGSDESGRIHIWEAATGKMLSRFSGHEDAVVSVKFSPTGEWMVSCSYDETARLWDVRNPSQPVEVQVLKGHSWWVWDAAFSPTFNPANPQGDNRLVTVSQDGKAIVWNLGQEPQRTPITNVAFQPYGTREPVASFEMVRESIFTGHDGPIYAVAFSPNGEEVATGSYDKRILMWNPAEVPAFNLDHVLLGKDESLKFREFLGHTAPVQTVEFSDDGQLLITGGRDNSVKIWSTTDARPVKTLRGHSNGVRSVDIAPDGRRVVSGGQDDRVILWNIDQYEEFRVLDGRKLVGHNDAVLGAKFSHDGQHILTAGRDRTARMWDTKSGTLLKTFEEGHEFLTSRGIFLPGGRVLATAAADNSVRLWNVATGTQLLRIPETGRSSVIAASADGRWLVTGYDPAFADEDLEADELPASGEQGLQKTGVRVWSIDALLASAERGVESVDLWERVKPISLNGHYSRVTTAKFEPAGNRLVTADSGGRVVFWDLEQQQEIWSKRHHRRRITECLFVPDGSHIYVASTDHTVSRIDAVTGDEDESSILKHSASVTAMSLSEDGRQLLTVSLLDTDLLNPGSTVSLWDTQSGEQLKSFDSESFAINDISFTPAGDHAILVTTENVVRVLDLRATEATPQNWKVLLDFQKLGGLVWAATFTDDGNSILTVGGSEAHIWDAVTLRKEISFSPHGAVAAADFSPSGEFIVTGSWDNSAKIWNVQTGQAVVKLQGGHAGYVNSAIFSPDGKTVLTSSDDMTAKIWNAETGRVIQVFQGHRGRVRQAIFSPDGTQVLTVSNDRTARLWDVQTGEQIGTPFTGHQWAVLCATFSSDGTRIVTGSEDNQARMWDVETHQTLAIFEGHTAAVSAVRFTKEGSRLFTASQDNTAKIWDATPERAGAEILTLTEQTQELTSISLSPDGSQVVTGSRDGTAVVWLTTGWKNPQDNKSSQD